MKSVRTMHSADKFKKNNWTNHVLENTRRDRLDYRDNIHQHIRTKGFQNVLEKKTRKDFVLPKSRHYIEGQKNVQGMVHVEWPFLIHYLVFSTQMTSQPCDIRLNLEYQFVAMNMHIQIYQKYYARGTRRDACNDVPYTTGHLQFNKKCQF